MTFSYWGCGRCKTFGTLYGIAFKVWRWLRTTYCQSVLRFSICYALNAIILYGDEIACLH